MDIPLLIHALFTLWGGFSYRWRGYGEGIAQREIRRLSCVLMPLAISYTAFPDNWYLLAAVGILSYLGIIVGHGRYFTLGKGPYPEREDNWPGKLIAPLRLSRSAHDTLALSITGLCFTLPVAVLLAVTGYHLAYLTLMIAGVVKPLGYYLAQKVNFPKLYDDHLFWAEVYYGLMLGFLFGLVFTRMV